MKKITMETEYNTMKEIAKELGIKFVGVKKETLVEQINNKIDEINATEKPKKGGKWYDQEGAFIFEEGQILDIVNHQNKTIINRRVQVLGPSTKRNAVKVQLICMKSGGLQKTQLSLDYSMVAPAQMNYPVISSPTNLMVI